MAESSQIYWEADAWRCFHSSKLYLHYFQYLIHLFTGLGRFRQWNHDDFICSFSSGMSFHYIQLLEFDPYTWGHAQSLDHSILHIILQSYCKLSVFIQLERYWLIFFSSFSFFFSSKFSHIIDPEPMSTSVPYSKLHFFVWHCVRNAGIWHL